MREPFQCKLTLMRMPSNPAPARRQLVIGGAATLLSLLAAPALASSRRTVAPMTDGPFYPARAWREQWQDWDADLSRVQRGGRVLEARGEHLGLELRLADTDGRAIDGAEAEIWECAVLAAYRHPRVPQTAGSFDEGFQGFGASRSAGDGTVRFRSIRPVPTRAHAAHPHQAAACELRRADLAAVHCRRPRQPARLPVAGAGASRPGHAGDEAAAGPWRDRDALAGAARAGAAGLTEMCEASR